MLEGGCSKTATPPCVATALKSSLLLLWISRLCAMREASAGDKPGTPCMQVGVRNAFGPPGRSFSLLYSLHGGASVIRPTMPDQEMRMSSSKHASSRMSCSELASRSNASKRERPCWSAAAEMGAKTSKRNPPLMWGSMRSSAVRAMLGGQSELPVLSLAAGRCVGADREGWSASCAGEKACVAGGLAVRLGVGLHCPEERPEWPPDCFRCGWTDAATPRALAGSLLWRIHARTGSCPFCRCPVGICGRSACLGALPPNCRVFSPFLFLYPFFWVAPPYAAWELGVCRIVLD